MIACCSCNWQWWLPNPFFILSRVVVVISDVLLENQDPFEQHFSNFTMQHNTLEDLLKHRFQGSITTASDSLGSGVGPRICPSLPISNNFPDDADDAHSAITLREPLLLKNCSCHTENYCRKEKKRHLWVLECGYAWGPCRAQIYRNGAFSPFLYPYTGKDRNHFRFASSSQRRNPEQSPDGLRGDDSIEEFSRSSATWLLLFSKVLFHWPYLGKKPRN